MTCCYINKTGLKLIAVCNDSRNYLKKHAAQYTSAACHICNSSKKKLKDIGSGCTVGATQEWRFSYQVVALWLNLQHVLKFYRILLVWISIYSLETTGLLFQPLVWLPPLPSQHQLCHELFIFSDCICQWTSQVSPSPRPHSHTVYPSVFDGIPRLLYPRAWPLRQHLFIAALIYFSGII